MLLAKVSDGADLADQAEADGVAYQTFRAVGRRDNSLPPELLAEVFRARKPGDSATVDGLELASGDYVVFEIARVQPGDPDSKPREQRLQERNALAQMTGDGSLSAYVTELRRRASVQVFEIDDEQL